jgi:O-antigen/teichoic acid export membrane protein
LDIAKKTKIIASINITAALVNVVLNIILIPLFGITGSALATMAGFCIMFSAYMIASQRYYPVPHRWSIILSATLATMAASAAIYFLKGTGTITGLIYKLLILVCVTGLVAWLLKGNDRRTRTRG